VIVRRYCNAYFALKPASGTRPRGDLRDISTPKMAMRVSFVQISGNRTCSQEMKAERVGLVTSSRGCQMPQSPLHWTIGGRTIQTNFDKLEATEVRCGTAGPQAFCLASCKSCTAENIGFNRETYLLRALRRRRSLVRLRT